MKKYLYLYLISFLLTSITVAAQSVKITRGPYLQVVTPTSVVVRWRTDQPTTGAIWFGPSEGQLVSSVRESQPTQEHQLTVSGLQPATKYNYAVGYDETKLTSGADYFVKTAPPTGDTRPLRFWVLGDFGSNSPNQIQVYNSYKKVAASNPADLWIWLGDNAYWGGLEEQYQEYVFNVYPQTLRNLPLFMTPGNHDYADSRTNFNITYYNSFSFPENGEAGGFPSNSKTYYSADYGNVHLISLDSQANQSDGFRLYDTTSTQVKWLKQDLATTKQPWKIVIFHHPPYSKGGHDCDVEEQMKLIRENLTPILERYGVDLVLNGHSHGYERTYRLKGMTGLARTFDKNKHLAEQTTGQYNGTPNSCPILTKGEGTVYVVNGSGGQLGGQSGDYPHPATVYNNVTVGGSMILDVTDNRLDAQFILTDGSVPDRFTILKNVNKTVSRNAQYGDTLQLAASWPATDYRWTSGQNTRQIQYVVDNVGTFPVTVKDHQNCLADVFQLTVPRPKLTARASGVVCAGQTLDVAAVLENAPRAADWQYDVFLSNASGDFTQEQLVGSGKLGDLKAALPVNLSSGSGYRLRIRPRDKPMVELIPSDPIKIGSVPSATLAGSTTVWQGESTNVRITFTGDGPWQGTLSDGTTFSGSTNPMVVSVKPGQSTTYTITSLSNACGKGATSGQASVTVQLIPTITATTATSACVGTSLPITATISNPPTGIDLNYDVLLSDATGNFTTEQIVGTGKLNELKATIPETIARGSGYRVQVRPKGIPYSNQVPTGAITIKVPPTATLAGSTTITQGESVSISIAFTGDGPWNGTLSEGTTFSGTGNPMIIQVKPTKSITYTVATVENVCGEGAVSGETNVTVLIPTGEEDFPGGKLRIYPNPVQNVLHLELTTTQKKEVHVTLLDVQGCPTFQKQAGVVSLVSESIPMPATQGIYMLKIRVGETTITRKVVRQ